MTTHYIPGFSMNYKRSCSKYHNRKTLVDGITFASKLESLRYTQLKYAKMAGQICWFTRQPSFLLPGGIRYRADFMVCNNKGNIWVEDTKGVKTEAFKLKEKLFREMFPDFFPLKILK